MLSHQQTIYRDFDIRGLYPTEITSDEVYKIAHALVDIYTPKKVAIGYDIRPSATTLRNALVRGFNTRGVLVIDLGLTTTPMTYFMCGTSDVDMAIMITASHMPSQYNGLKITVEDAKPVPSDILQKIRSIVGAHTFSETTMHENVLPHALQGDWITKFKNQHDLRGANLSVVIDPANMIGILEIETFKAFAPDLIVHSIFDTYDHTCPNHEANPVKHDTLKSLGEAVLLKKADIGIAFDGDADRVGFVDEVGVPVPSDVIGALLARNVLQKYPGATIITDVRSSRSLIDEVHRLGGVIYREKVGHTHIRNRMRAEEAVLGIELSGHFFFKDTFYSEGGPLPAFLILELLHQMNKPLSELANEVVHYAHSGEINSTIIRSPEEIYKTLKQLYPTAQAETLDGLTLTNDDWWCNVRPSANDPVMRLNVEAKTIHQMETVRDTLLACIRS